MRRLSVLVLLLGIALSVSTERLQAAVSDAAVLFLRIAPGARSAGMGEAFVAIADDAQATHWNPAGLGEYPLANAWYVFSVGDDARLKELARRAFDGKLSPDFRESFESWQFEGNTIKRYVDGEWLVAETITIDPERPLLTTLARRLVSTDKDRVKRAVRSISYENTGVSFAEINNLRLELLQIAGKDANLQSQINGSVERLLGFWQDLRFDVQHFDALRNVVADIVLDGSIGEGELLRLDEQINACEAVKRPQTIRIPYPVLLTIWRGWEVPWERSIERLAVMENNVPTDGYARYDIWALTNFGLMRYDGETWKDGDEIQPRRGDNLRDIVARALGTTRSEIVDPRLEMVARANNIVSREQLQEVRSGIESLLPESYDQRSELIQQLGRLEDAWLNCRLHSERVRAFIALYDNIASDSVLTESEIDQLTFSLEKAFTDRLPESMIFPFRAVFDGKINDLAVDQKLLYVATSTGLYRYNGRSWEKFNVGEDSLDVHCIDVFKRGQIWLGTDRDVRAYRDGKWTVFGPAEGISKGPIKQLLVKNERLAWAAADDDLFVFNGTNWSNTFAHTASVNDSAQSVVARFYGQIDEVRLDLATINFQMLNPMFTADPQAGQVVKVPFAPAFEGRITALEMDKDNNLWVGTDLGLKKFDGRTWTSYGYKPVKVEEPMAIEELAKRYLNTEDQDRIASFVTILKRKNMIQEAKLHVGRVVYVYSNPAGSPIQALYNQGDRIYVGSIYGTFSYDGRRWERYYHEGLHTTSTRDIVGKAGEIWFATSDRVVVAARGKRELTFTHANWLPELADDLYYEFLSYVHPFGNLGTIGANVTFLSYGTIQTTGETSADITGEINPFDVAVTLSYGTRASRNLAVGLSAKIIYSRLSVVGAGREVGEGSGTSFAVEGGLLYQATRRLRLAAVITNLGPNMTYIDAAQSDALPRNLALGFAYKLIDSPYNKLTLVGEINKLLATLDDDFSTELREAVENVGIEYWYGSLLALRAGYIYDQEGEIKTPTLGVGLQLKSKYRLDFAYIPSSESVPLSNTLRTSLTVKL